MVISEIFFLMKFVVTLGRLFGTVLKCDLHYEFLYPVNVFYFTDLFSWHLDAVHVIGHPSGRAGALLGIYKAKVQSLAVEGRKS